MSITTQELIAGLERAIAGTSDTDWLVLRGPGYEYKFKNDPVTLKRHLAKLKRNTRRVVKHTKPDGSPRIKL